jgi:hypothetical protein
VPLAIIPKSTLEAGAAPLPSELEDGELALNLADGLLYAKLATGEVRCLNPPIDEFVEQTAQAAASSAASEIASGLFETGEWTPTIVALGDGAVQPAVTYDARTYGRWHRFGNVVFAGGRIGATAIVGGSGFAAISGFPFPSFTAPEGSLEQSSGFVGWSGGTCPKQPHKLFAATEYDAYLAGLITVGSGETERISSSLCSIADITPPSGPLNIVFGYMYNAVLED